MCSASCSTVGFGYDALGRRVTRTAVGVTTRFVRSGSENGGAVLLEKQGSTVTKSYLYGAAGLARSGSKWLGYDGLGSARTVWNGAGSAVGSNRYDAFGNVTASSGIGSGSYGFAATSGYRSDADAGLQQVGARYYDPQVGQFLSRDTYLVQKPYNYCEHDPVNSLDPSGHEPSDWDNFFKGVRAVMVAAGTILGGGTATGGPPIPPTHWFNPKPGLNSVIDWLGKLPKIPPILPPPGPMPGIPWFYIKFDPFAPKMC